MNEISTKMNKFVAGYHMLMLLSEADGDFAGSEGKIIIQYLQEHFPFPVNLDREIELLSTMPRDNYFLHFCKAMDDFYQDSTEKERHEFLDFAVKLVKADDNISKEENIFIDELFKAWDNR